MSTMGAQATFKIYDEQYQGGKFEVISQNLDAFNAASRGAITLVSQEKRGAYEKEAFFEDLSASAISRRDLEASTDLSDVDMTQGEIVRVKVSRTIGPFAKTVAAWKQIGLDDKQMSFLLGKMVAEAKIADYLNTGLLALVAAIKGVGATVVHDITGASTKTLTYDAMIDGLTLFGDKQQNIVCWVCHSKPGMNLMKAAAGTLVSEIAGVTITTASIPSLNRPLIMIDSPALTDANGSATDTYNVLGLTPGALGIIESEQETIVDQIITGKAIGLVRRIQGEHAFNVGVKGFAYDYGNGGANPTDATIGTQAYWDKVAASIKNTAGICIKCQ